MLKLNCPNINDNNWKNLVRKYGEQEAYNIFVQNDFEIPDYSIYSESLSSPKEKTIDNNLDSYINILDKRISKMYDNIRNEKDFSKKEEIKNRINNLEEKLEILKTTRNINLVNDIANSQLEDVKSIMSKEVVKESELNEVYKFINTYANITNSLLTPEMKDKQMIVDSEGELVEDRSQIYKNLLNIELETKELSSRFFDLVKQSILNDAKKNINENLTEEEIFGNIKDITWTSMQTRDAASQGVILLDLMNIYHRFAMNKADQETEILQKQRIDQYNLIKQNSIFNQHGWELFFQKDKDGKQNWNLVNRYSDNYWKERSSYVENINSKDPNKIKKGIKWYRDNHFFIDYSAFTNEDLTINTELLEKYKSNISSEFGDNRTDEIVKETVEKYYSFLTERNLKIQYLSDVYGKDTSEYQKAIFDWDVSNSPLIASQEILKNKIILDSSGKYSKKNYYQYLVSKPKNEEKFYDKNYSIINNDPQLLSYYNYLSSTIHELVNILPQSFISREGVQRNFIPSIKKSLLEKIKTDGVGGLLKGSNQYWIQSITQSKESDTIYDEINTETGMADYSLPIYLMNRPKKFNVEKEAFEESYEDLSNNLDKVLQASIELFTMYKYKSQVEDKVKILKHYIDNMEEDIDKIDSLGNTIINKKGLSNIKNLANYNFEVFYDKRLSKEGITDKRILDSEEKETSKSIDNKILELESELNKEGLTTEQIEPIQDRINKLKEYKDNLGSSFSWGQSFRSILKYVQLKSQAFNLFSATNELIFGQISSLVHSQGDTDFNTKQWGTAFRLLASQDKKSKALCRRFKTVTQITDYDNIGSKIEEKLYYLQEGADYMSKGIPLIASMLNKEITTKDGKIINLYQAFDNDGKLNEELFDEDTLKQWNPSGEEEHRNEFYKFQNKVTQLNKKLHGNYDRDSRVLMRKSSVGYALSQFRLWMVEGFYSRLEEEKYDSLLDRNTKGRYRTVYNIFEKEGLGKLLLRLFKQSTFQKSAFEGLSDVDSENMKKNLCELYVLLGTLAFGALLLKGLDDEDEKENFAINFFTNSIFRLQTDIMFYFNPSEFEKINKSILPVMRIYEDTNQIISAFIKMLQGEDQIENGVFKGKSRFVKEGMEFFPVTNTSLSLYRQVNEVLEK